ncbi:MAG: DUF2950 family protein, partial [Acidobacteriota bacterium]
MGVHSPAEDAGAAAVSAGALRAPAEEVVAACEARDNATRKQEFDRRCDGRDDETDGKYRQTDHDGDGVMEFAPHVISTEGTRDGLYWPEEDGAPESPIGEF